VAKTSADVRKGPCKRDMKRRLRDDYFRAAEFRGNLQAFFRALC
jgi:hypothetical protein